MIQLARARTDRSVQVDPVVALVIGAVLAAVPAFVAYLTKRSIDAVDKSISSLSTKVDGLANKDTEFAIKLAELQVRVVYLEILLKVRAP